MRFSRFFLLSIFFVVFGFEIYSHQGTHKTIQADLKDEKQKLENIDALYSQSIKSIFDNKCLDCHGGTPHFPWYHHLPLAKQLMDHDIKEAKEHLDMSGGFPFKGHGSPQEDLEAIEKTIKNKSMPPWRYWIIHWKCRLSKEEREEISNWVTQSLEILKIQ